MTCHKAIETQLFRSLDLRADGFAIEPEITARPRASRGPITLQTIARRRLERRRARPERVSR